MGLVIFIIFWVVVAIIIAFIFYQRGKKVLTIFPDEKEVKVLYRDRLAIGHVVNGGKQRLGNTDKSMDVIITTDELWLRSSPFLAGTMQRQGLLHRMNKKAIKKLVVEKNNRVEISFITSLEKRAKINLQIKSPNTFIDLLKT